LVLDFALILILLLILNFICLTCVHFFEKLSDLWSDHSIRVGAPARANSVEYWRFILNTHMNDCTVYNTPVPPSSSPIFPYKYSYFSVFCMHFQYFYKKPHIYT
jgi:hypothetical protein